MVRVIVNAAITPNPTNSPNCITWRTGEVPSDRNPTRVVMLVSTTASPMCRITRRIASRFSLPAPTPA